MGFGRSWDGFWKDLCKGFGDGTSEKSMSVCLGSLSCSALSLPFSTSDTGFGDPLEAFGMYYENILEGIPSVFLSYSSGIPSIFLRYSSSIP